MNAKNRFRKIMPSIRCFSARKLLGTGTLVLALLTVVPGCDSDEVGDNYYTFTGELMGGYFDSRPQEFSEFARMLDTTDVASLLNTYGDYTCFAPTNDALKVFYLSKGKKSLADFPLDTIAKIVYDHLIKDASIPTEDFREGRLSKRTMSGRYVLIDFSSVDNVLNIHVNNSVITVKDQDVANGVVHIIDQVLQPTDKTLVKVLEDDDRFNLFSNALLATGLDKKLTAMKDESFVPKATDLALEGKQTLNMSYIRVPKERKFGFTAIVESDSTYAANGIANLADMAAYAKTVYDEIYPADADVTDYTDRRNSLNRFVAYHLLDRQLSHAKFIYDYDNTGIGNATHSVKTYDMFEYVETMCPNTLLEVRTMRQTVESNILNYINASGKGIRFTENVDNDAVNGVYHEIDGVLTYSKDFVGELTSKRIRMDAASFFPEFANNNIRGSVTSSTLNSEKWNIPRGYIDRVKSSETTAFGYYSSDPRFKNYQGDEVFLSGMYDFTITTPPIPAGTYEIRFGYLSNGSRGKAQFYWDGVPCGIPLDMNITADNPNIGYVKPGSDAKDPLGYENDKMLRNRGYMKGPDSFTVIYDNSHGGWYQLNSARFEAKCLRRILGIYAFDKDGTHEFAVKALRKGEFMFDYLEFVPVEMLQYEGIE